MIFNFISASKEPFFWQAEELDDAVDSNVVVMPENLEQKYVLVPEDIRDPYLVHMVKLLLEEKMAGNEQLIIFSKTCKSVQVIGMMLQKIGARAVVLHSILKQSQRFAALEQFKSSKARVLVATDVASRGLDLPHVSIVINHNVPGKKN
jgi:ATP-dependent RNA helicase DDX49/DBP8